MKPVDTRYQNRTAPDKTIRQGNTLVVKPLLVVRHSFCWCWHHLIIPGVSPRHDGTATQSSEHQYDIAISTHSSGIQSTLHHQSAVKALGRIHCSRLTCWPHYRQNTIMPHRGRSTPILPARLAHSIIDSKCLHLPTHVSTRQGKSTIDPSDDARPRPVEVRRFQTAW